MAQDNPSDSPSDRPRQATQSGPDAPQAESSGGDDRDRSHDDRGRERDGGKPDRPPSHWLRWTLIGVGAVIAVVIGLVFGVPWLIHYFKTASTDDAYINGHVSLISTRVVGYVQAIYVDDNQRVRKGDLLLELDPRPYRVAVNQKKAALDVAEANLKTVTAQARAQEAAARAAWFSLVGAQEQVRYQIATLRSGVVNLRLQEANLELAKKESDRVRRLVKRQAATQEELPTLARPSTAGSRASASAPGRPSRSSRRRTPPATS